MATSLRARHPKGKDRGEKERGKRGRIAFSPSPSRACHASYMETRDTFSLFASKLQMKWFITHHACMIQRKNCSLGKKIVP